jgi:toxin ParE1/3/4
LAQADLTEIWKYTEENWSVRQAETYLTQLGPVFHLLTEQPEMTRLRQDFTPPLRLYAFQSHLIAYTTDATILQVIRILHMRSNWAEALAE